MFYSCCHGYISYHSFTAQCAMDTCGLEILSLGGHSFQLHIIAAVSQILPELLLCFVMCYDHMLVQDAMAT